MGLLTIYKGLLSLFVVFLNQFYACAWYLSNKGIKLVLYDYFMYMMQFFKFWFFLPVLKFQSTVAIYIPLYPKLWCSVGATRYTVALSPYKAKIRYCELRRRSESVRTRRWSAKMQNQYCDGAKAKERYYYFSFAFATLNSRLRNFAIPI